MDTNTMSQDVPKKIYFWRRKSITRQGQESSRTHCYHGKLRVIRDIGGKNDVQVET